MSFFRVLLVVLLQLPFILCSPRPPLGVRFEKRSALPLLALPDATYRAANYNPSSDIYTFKNIRFAAPPVGDLRWAKPAPPQVNKTIQDGSHGPKCVQTAILGLNLMGSGNNSPIGAAVNQFLGGIPIPLFDGGDEDCLFLDVYVPGKALKNPSLKLPVAVFVFGGAYLFGSKDSLEPELPFYDGSGMVGQSGNNMIFVAMNYRLGAYGFLAGTTMEQDGLPNAGLWDQRAAFQWVKDHISLVGGDPTKVTAMGESAGAGSLLHHIVAQGGKLDPLFSKAIIQSPAFEMMWDRNGTVEDIFQNFASLAGCKGQGVDCLRAASPGALLNANNEVNAQQAAGTFALGPTADGSFIRQLPSLELAAGSFWKLDSLILSHTADESSIFVSGAVDTDEDFNSFVGTIFPSYTVYAGVTKLIDTFYPALAISNAFATESDRVAAFVRDSCFTCNVRYLAEAFGDAKVWNMQYSVTPGVHGTDLLPTFYNSQLTANSLLEDIMTLVVPVIGPLFAGLSVAMQSYFVSYITTGDPNTNRKIFNIPPTVQWNHPVTAGEQITGVVNIGDLGFSVISDTQTQKTPCDFWRNVAAAVTNLGGYAPPGTVMQQSLLNGTADPSANYVGGNAP